MEEDKGLNRAISVGSFLFSRKCSVYGKANACMSGFAVKVCNFPLKNGYMFQSKGVIHQPRLGRRLANLEIIAALPGTNPPPP